MVCLLGFAAGVTVITKGCAKLGLAIPHSPQQASPGSLPGLSGPVKTRTGGQCPKCGATKGNIPVAAETKELWAYSTQGRKELQEARC